MDETRVTLGNVQKKGQKEKEISVLTYFTKNFVIDRSENTTLLKEYYESYL